MDEHKPVCPAIQSAFELLGRKWVTLIIHVLSTGQKHYCDLQRAVPDLSDRVLSQRMKELEGEGIVKRTVDTGSPVRVSYSLTERGRALSPILEGIATWAHDYPPQAQPDKLLEHP